MHRHHTHANGTLLPRGQLGNRAKILLGAEIELASSLLQLLRNWLALLFMLLAVLVLTFLVTIPNAMAAVAHLEGVTCLSARRTHLLGRGGPIFRVGYGFILLSSADSPSDNELS